MLNWSSYLRMHHQDPQWMQQVIKKDALATLDFSVWEQLSSWDSKAKIEFIDTTGLDLDDVSNKVVYWINNVNINSVDLVPNTDYKVYKNPKNAVAMVDEKLHAYNKQCVAPTQTPDVINVNYVIKDNEEMIAGICADIYVWKILYISLLFVEKNYRNQDLASYLLNKVEAEARTIGVKLVHLDTFAFQAKDFYLKHGYEIFGVLDDCPEGYKRYYLKKVL